MAIKWKTLFLQILVWFSLELTLNLLGFDDLVDYTEFILETQKIHSDRISQDNCVFTAQFPFNGAFCLPPLAVV